MQLPNIPLVVLDTETTGFTPKVNGIIEFASMRVQNGEVIHEYEELYHAKEVPAVVEVLTRIRTTDLADKATFADRKPAIEEAIGMGAVIVGQNVGFDIGMLKGQGIDLSQRPWIDTSMLASLVFPELESYSLGYMSNVLNLNHHPVHRALGDVRATLELLEKCWQRLLTMPEELLAPARAIMEKSTSGYRMLFAALPLSQSTARPAWLDCLRQREVMAAADITMTVDLAPARDEKIVFIEETLDPLFLRSALDHAAQASDHQHWIAVKNLENTLRRLPAFAETIRVIQPASLLPDPSSVSALLGQEQFTADEATLAIKLLWYRPEAQRELPIHGGEEAVWKGKIACSETSAPYVAQFASLPSVTLLDHRQLLQMIAKEDSVLCTQPSGLPHVIIDDASMLEDTGTKAYGFMAAVETLRASVNGDPLLTKFVDLLELWVEKTRNGQDLRYITQMDLSTPEAKGLREQLSAVLVREQGSTQRESLLTSLQSILDPQKFAGRIVWIETKQNGNQSLHSVPERIDQLLQRDLFARFHTTLLIPSHIKDTLGEVVPSDAALERRQVTPMSPTLLTVSFAAEPTLDQLLTNPLPGKTVILLPSRGMIDTLYVKYTENLEAKGATIICQGLGGGQGRMQAEFTAAKSPALWLLTPWMFEGIDLPPDTVDRLIIQALPFDYPSHPVLGKRAERYRDAFGQYMLPRLTHRLFRLLRTFSRFRTELGDVRILDDRLMTKSYGAKLKEYLLAFGETMELQAAKPKRQVAKKVEEKAGQLPLF